MAAATAPQALPPLLRRRCLRELERNGRVRSLSPAGREELLDACIRFAHDRAEEVRRASASAHPPRMKTFLAKHGLHVVEMRTAHGFPFLAEYDAFERRVEVYPDAVRTAAQLLATAGCAFVTADLLMEMCLAHELLHHFDYAAFGRIGGCAPVPGRLLGIPLRRCCPEAGEVAAHEFVRLCFAPPVSPLFFNDFLSGGGAPDALAM